MSLPLPGLTFYRLADQSPAAATIAGLLDAIYAALTSTTDYRGTSLASTHLWTVARQQVTGTTKAVYCTAPSGTPMGLAPMIILAGDSGAPTPTMLSPDSFTASNVLLGIVKNAGAWNAWDNAAPATSGTFSGYWRAAGTTWNATGAKVRVYVSEEVIFVQLIGSTVTTQAWLAAGAWLEPHTSYATSSGLTAESDDRLYGMWVTGGGNALQADWLDTAASSTTPAPWEHYTTAGGVHCMVWQPTTTAIYTCGRRWIQRSNASTAQLTDASGRWIGHLQPIHRTSASLTYGGNALGMARAMYPAGLIQSGEPRRSGSTDLYHVVSRDTGGTANAMYLRAAA